MLAYTLLAARLAQADGLVPNDPLLGPAWELSYRRSQGWGLFGVAYGGAGAGSIALGAMIARDPDLGVGGAVLSGLGLFGGIQGMALGAPVASVSSLRAARALQAGGVDVGRGWGVAALALSGSSLLLAVHAWENDSPGLWLASGGALLGSYGASVGQMVVNRASFRQAQGISSREGVQLRAVPTDDGALLVLDGRF